MEKKDWGLSANVPGGKRARALGECRPTSLKKGEKMVGWKRLPETMGGVHKED